MTTKNDWENVGNDWDVLLAGEFEKFYFKELREFLTDQYRRNTVYPEKCEIFNALRATSYKDAKVVIVGQDPYPDPDEAHGLAFSVRKRCDELPKSLDNIFEEIWSDSDIKCSCPQPKHNGDLTPWTKQGVLLLNAVPTVVHGCSGSHIGHKWETFTKSVLKMLNEKPEPVVFLLWGYQAQELGKGTGLFDGLDEKTGLNANGDGVNINKHLVLVAQHPSWGIGIKDCKHFSKTNAFLGDNAIKWQIPDVK